MASKLWRDLISELAGPPALAAAAPEGAGLALPFHPVADLVAADHRLIGLIVAANNRQFLQVETGLLEFLDGRLGCRVRWIDCYDGRCC
jgi:hypothetical protein